MGGLFSNRQPPSLPEADEQYSKIQFSRLLAVLRLYFAQISAIQQVNVAKINISLDTLPTEADLASLRDGDVYRDTTADNVLKVKV